MDKIVNKILTQDWFNIKHFFLIGTCCMIIMALAGITGAIINWEITHWTSKVQTIGSGIFTLMLSGLFGYSYLDAKTKEEEHKKIMEEMDNPFNPDD